ncbi:MAG: DUF4340 domain-containing protein [Cyanobacteria bacterium P01_F01_bin.3]
MMLKRGTLLLLLSAIALGGAVILIENQVGPRSTEQAAGGDVQTTDSEKLFPFEEDEVEQFSVTRQLEAPAAEQSEEQTKETLSFVKTESGTWEMTAPEAAKAEGGAIAFLLSQVSTPTAVPVSVKANNLEEFGLAEPEATVSITANGSEYALYVGAPDFQGDKRYVQTIEMPAEQAAQPSSTDAEKSLKIYAISGSIISAVTRPTEDWLLANDDTTESTEETEPTAGSDSEESDKQNADAADNTATEAKPEASSTNKPPTDASGSEASEPATTDPEEPKDSTEPADRAADPESSTAEEDAP